MAATCPWDGFRRAEPLSQQDSILRAWESQPADRIVVLDDDPTGCQTVHDVPVWLDWDEATLRTALLGPHRLFYVLTNIRSVPEDEAESRHLEIATRLHDLANQLKLRIHVISRSDSTLRGHFPADLRPFWSLQETPAVPAAILLIPAFFEGGRYTFQGTHYVVAQGGCVPAHETEFAQDKAFGFQSAYLPDWVGEKWPAQQAQVQVLSLATIRQGVAAVSRALSEADNLRVIAVDALDYGDLEVVALACLEQQSCGKEFLFRTAASFVRAYGGISNQGLLKAEDLMGGAVSSTGGLVVVGSYVAKTTTQLAKLVGLPSMVSVELDVAAIVKGLASARAEVSRAIAEISSALTAGRDVVCYTSRTLWTAPSAEESLQVGRAVADAVNEVVKGLSTRPSFLVAKGGITSHEVAQLGLGVQHTWVLGQIASGVPVWELGSESKWPGLPYVVFPGNVGEANTLADVVRDFRLVREQQVLEQKLTSSTEND